ncbi:methylthioribose kinase-like [Silene latifolia]|uniref:methylthioribose kinase-like n=1 Tax=Silene latifolia TaxID=37657 RepID=UPI003D7883C4
MAVNDFRQLDKVSLGEYIKATPCLSSKLSNKVDDMQIQAVDEGLMNFVYIVKSSGGSMVIKQALPYIRSMGESMPQSKERAKYEAKALQVYASLCPSHVPQLYHFDPWLSLIAIKYLEPPHILLTKGLIAGIQYPLLAESISEFFTRVFFHSSLLYTSQHDHERAVAEFYGNVEMIKLMEQLTFCPFEESEYNSWTSPQLDLDVKAVQEDDAIKLQVAQLKSIFCEKTQALIHGDFHAGSVMVTQNSVQVIDPEFAFYGPMGYDIGTFFRNLIVSFFAQDGLATHQNDRQNYKTWLLETLEKTWTLFELKFIKLWVEHNDCSAAAEVILQKKYMEDVFQDALGFCAAYLIASVIRVCTMEEFECIDNVSKKAECERNTLNFGRMLLTERSKFKSIGQVVSSLKQYMLQYPSSFRSRC